MSPSPSLQELQPVNQSEVIIVSDNQSEESIVVYQQIRSHYCCVSTNQTPVFISYNNQSDISFDQSEVRIICDNLSEASIISDNQSEESIYLTTLDTPGHDSNTVVVVTILDDHGGAAVSVTSGVNGRGGLGHAHHSTGDHPRPECGDTA